MLDIVRCPRLTEAAAKGASANNHRHLQLRLPPASLKCKSSSSLLGLCEQEAHAECRRVLRARLALHAHMVRLGRLRGRDAAQVGVCRGADVGVPVGQVGVRVMPHHVLLAPHEGRRAHLHKDARKV